MEVNSGLCVVPSGWTKVFRTDRERQTTNYSRSGKIEVSKVAWCRSPKTARRRRRRGLSRCGAAEQNEYVKAVASGLRIAAKNRAIEVMFNKPAEVIVRDDRREGNFDLQVYVGVLPGSPQEGQTAKNSFALKLTGAVDDRPVQMTLDVSKPDQLFDGLGSNFRTQNPKTDPGMIQYNLDNLRVA